MNTIITEIIYRVNKNTTQVPLVIAIAGGSGSGKSHLSSELRHELKQRNIETVVVNQDDFSIGRSFKNKHNSLYKWDDPENYRLSECHTAVLSLQKGSSYTFDAYTLSAHEPNLKKTLEFSKNQDSNPKIIILEGIFAWYGPLSNIVDYKIFLYVDYYKRFILRANRNINQIKNTDLNTVVSQYFSHVAFAERDLLEPIKHKADIVINRDVDFAHIDLKLLKPHKQPKANTIKSIYTSKDAGIYISSIDNVSKITVVINGYTLFDEVLTEQNKDLLVHNAPNAQVGAGTPNKII